MHAPTPGYPCNIAIKGTMCVSNFCIAYLKRLFAKAVNQIELHPSYTQEALVEFCREKGIVVTSYFPLGSIDSPLLTNSVATKIAAAHGVSPANILISLQPNKPGISVLSKSVTNTRIAANAKVIDLTPAEIQELQDIDKTVSATLTGRAMDRLD